MKGALRKAGLYMLARLQEPSTWRGLVLIVGAGAWHRLDKTSQGELIMQYAILLAGLIAASLPDSRNG